MPRTKMNYTTDDIISYLESKILDENITDSEYELYIAYNEYGEMVFSMPEYKSVVRRVQKGVKQQWDL